MDYASAARAANLRILCQDGRLTFVDVQKAQQQVSTRLEDRMAVLSGFPVRGVGPVLLRNVAYAAA